MIPLSAAAYAPRVLFKQKLTQGSTNRNSMTTMQFVKAPDIARGRTTHQLLSFQTIELFDAAPWCCTSPQARCTWHFLAPWLHGSTLDCTTGIQCIHGTACQERSLETSAPAWPSKIHQSRSDGFTIQEVANLAKQPMLEAPQPYQRTRGIASDRACKQDCNRTGLGFQNLWSVTPGSCCCPCHSGSHGAVHFGEL